MSLLDKRIIIVTGKGGTGKTTIAAALGLWAARSGKKTLICETHGTNRVCPLFGRTSDGYEPVQVHRGLHVLSITSESAIEDYVVQQIKVKKLYKLVFRNRVMGPFMDAVPGLHDAVHLGKVFDLAREVDGDGNNRWDLVIVDAPATGHGLHMFDSPRAMMELTRVGPVYEGVRQVDEVIGDPTKTALVLTCLPEAMPVSETLDLWKRLGDRKDQVAACILNEVIAPPRSSTADWKVAAEHLRTIDDPAVKEAVELTETWMDKAQNQRQARDLLAQEVKVPLIELPLLPRRDLRFQELQTLSQELDCGLEPE